MCGCPCSMHRILEIRIAMHQCTALKWPVEHGPPGVMMRLHNQLPISHRIPLCTACRPTSLQELLAIKAQHNDAKLVVGNTEVGIEMKFKVMAYPVLVGATHIPELNKLEVCPPGPPSLALTASMPHGGSGGSMPTSPANDWQQQAENCIG